MPVGIPIPSAFRKYVRGVFETGCLALYKEKNKGINKEKKKMYADDNNIDNDNDEEEKVFFNTINVDKKQWESKPSASLREKFELG